MPFRRRRTKIREVRIIQDLEADILFKLLPSQCPKSDLSNMAEAFPKLCLYLDRIQRSESFNGKEKIPSSFRGKFKKVQAEANEADFIKKYNLYVSLSSQMLNAFGRELNHSLCFSPEDFEWRYEQFATSQLRMLILEILGEVLCFYSDTAIDRVIWENPNADFDEGQENGIQIPIAG